MLGFDALAGAPLAAGPEPLAVVAGEDLEGGDVVVVAGRPTVAEVAARPTILRVPARPTICEVQR